MVNTMFADREDFVRHLNTALPVSQARGAELFEDFRESGYVARQENTGLTVTPALWGGSLYGALGELTDDSPGRVQVVMLSHPSLTDEEYDSWAEVVQTWSAALPVQTKLAYAREIKAMKRVDDGIPLTTLHKDMPATLLFTYRRVGDFVVVVDPPLKNARKIFTTKNIG